MAGDAYKGLKCREIGYVLGKAYWGKGLMPQAVARVLHFCFEDLKLDAVFCGYFERNRQSARVNEKMGFQYIKKHVYTTQIWHKGKRGVYCAAQKRLAKVNPACRPAANARQVYFFGQISIDRAWDGCYHPIETR